MGASSGKMIENGEEKFNVVGKCDKCTLNLLLHIIILIIIILFMIYYIYRKNKK